MKSLAIHSHKGGVGKTTIAVNIAVELAKTHNVCLIDNDLAGPSIQTFFEPQSKSYFNDYLDELIQFDQCIHEYKNSNLKGSLLYMLADPSNRSMEKILRLDKKYATKMLRQLVNLKKLIEKKYEVDYLIIDTSPGISILTANAFVATDNILFVNKLSNADIDGSANMIEGILEYMNNRSFLIANQIPLEKIENNKERMELLELIERHLDDRIGKEIIDLIGILPLDFNLQMIEYETARRTMMGEVKSKTGRTNRYIYSIDEPDSVFMRYLKPIIKQIFS